VSAPRDSRHRASGFRNVKKEITWLLLYITVKMLVEIFPLCNICLLLLYITVKMVVEVLPLCNICYVFKQSIRDCFGEWPDITTETLMLFRLQSTKVTIRTQNLATQKSVSRLMESPFIESQMHLIRSILWRKKEGQRHKVKNLA